MDFLQALTAVKDVNLSGNQEWFKIPVTNRIDDMIPKAFDYRAVPTISMEARRMQFVGDGDHAPVGCRCTLEVCDHRMCSCSTMSYGPYNAAELRFDSPDSLTRSTWQYAIDCANACACQGHCGRHFLVGHTSRYLFVDYISPIKGFGIRAAQHMKKGSIVSEYAGWYTRMPTADRRHDNEYQYVVNDRLGRAYLIDALHAGNISRFYNHSCSPNLGRLLIQESIPTPTFEPAPRLVFVTKKNVLPGDELTIDYGIDNLTTLYCFCYSKACKRPPPDDIPKPLPEWNPWRGNDHFHSRHRAALVNKATDLGEVVVEIDDDEIIILQ